MPVDEKQRSRLPPKIKRATPAAAATTTTPPAAAVSRSTTDEAATTGRKPLIAASSADLTGAIKSTFRDAVFERRPYLKFAFANPYNLTLLVGALAASAITLNPLPAIVALGLEGLWLLHAPESKLLKRILWDPKFEKIRTALEQRALNERIETLPERKRERVEYLAGRQQQIRTLAAQNPSFTGELLRDELVKTGQLVEAFIEMSLTCARYEEYLASVDLNELERDKRRWKKTVDESKKDGPQADIARKNLAIINKRSERLEEIRNYLSIAYGQLDLIENSFQLIADQIVTMQSPQELSGQLDELLDGVESIKQTAIDTENLLGTL